MTLTTAVSEQAQPNAADPTLTPPAAGADPAPAPAATSTDTDEIELQEALAAVKAEETAGKEPGAEAAAAAAPAAPAAGQKTPPAAAADAPMIPKARLDQVLGEKSKLEQDVAYLKGQLDARKEPPAATAGKPAAAEPSPEDKIAAVHLEIDALAEKFDLGEMSMKDFKAAERALLAKENAIREEARPKPAAQAPVGDSELYLETLTAELEEKHPWTGVFEAVGTEADWAYLAAQAKANLTERGIDVKKLTPITRYEIRKETAKLADELGPALLTTRAQAKGITLPGQQAAPAAPAAAQKPLSPEAKARAAALAKAAGHPPNIAAMSGSAGDPTAGSMSDAQIEAMTDDDFDKLPKAVRDKLLGRTAA